MTVELYFLGEPQFRKDAQAIEIKSAKAIALLAYLAVTDQLQPRERIMALLWGESAEEAARKNLRNTLWIIRREFGDALITSGEDRLGLARSAWTDVRTFVEAAGQTGPDGIQAAIDLYRGPFLDGVNLVEAPDFEVWTTTERERFSQLYLRGLSARVSRYRAEGQWDQMIATAQAALTQDNLQEPMYRALMEAYAFLGDRPAALRQFEVLRSVLERELGVEPLPETANLAKAILEGSPSTIPPTLAPLASVKKSRGDREPLFVGRVAEREILNEELTAATRMARVVLLTGEVGIGKSRLWHEWSAGLDAGWLIVAARCLESTQSLPFAPLLQLLRTPALQAMLGPASRVPLVWLAEIAHLMPELRLAHPDLAAPAPLPAGEERRRLSEAIVQTLLTMGSAGLVFFLDDAHWADQSTLDWLGYLVDRLRDHPLLAVVAYRPEEASAGLIRLAAGWTRQGMARRLSLGRLSQEESAALIAELHVEPTTTHLVQAQGAGNPYFLIELARSRRPNGHPDPSEGSLGLPPALAELVRARLERLSSPTRQVLQAAATLEPDVDFAALRRASGRDEEETLDALDELLAAGILQESGAPVPIDATPGSPAAGPALPLPGSTFNFTHPLVADVVRDGLSGARRRYLYRRAAEALEAIHAGHLDEVAGRLAHAYLDADEPKRAATYYEVAAQRALVLTALSEAVAFYRQAVSLAPTPERQLALGHVLMLQESPPSARPTLEEALAGFLAEGDRLGAARTSLELAATYLPVGRGDEVLRLAEQSLVYLDTHANPDADPEAHAQSHFLLGAGYLQSGRMDEAEAQLTEAARLSDEKGLPGMASRSSFELGNLLAQRGDLPGAIAAYHRTIAEAEAGNEPLQTVLGYNNAAYHEALAGDLAASHSDIAAGLALDDALALVTPRPYLLSTRGELALAEGSWDEAERWFREALTEADRQANLDLVAGCQAGLARAARGRADLDAALDLLEQARGTAESASGPYRQTQIDLWLAAVLLERGERAAATGVVTEAEALLTGTGYAGLVLTAQRLRAGLAAGT